VQGQSSYRCADVRATGPWPGPIGRTPSATSRARSPYRVVLDLNARVDSIPQALVGQEGEVGPWISHGDPTVDQRHAPRRRRPHSRAPLRTHELAANVCLARPHRHRAAPVSHDPEQGQVKPTGPSYPGCLTFRGTRDPRTTLIALLTPTAASTATPCSWALNNEFEADRLRGCGGGKRTSVRLRTSLRLGTVASSYSGPEGLRRPKRLREWAAAHLASRDEAAPRMGGCSRNLCERNCLNPYLTGQLLLSSGLRRRRRGEGGDLT
jgi:hypothetical protein